LAARIDRAEARLSEGVAEVVRARRGDYRSIVMPISGGVGVYAAPGSPFNKLIGLGFDGPLDLAAIEAIEREWRERDEAVRVELSILADPTIPVALSERGYHVHGYENVLGLALDDVAGDAAASDANGVTIVDESGAHQTIASGPAQGAPAQAATAITVEQLKDEDERTWIDVAVSAFMELDGTGSAADDAIPRAALEEVLTDFSCAPGFRRSLARIDHRPVGIGSLRIDGDLAQVSGAGTLVDARGRGVQKALLHRRLTDARAAGANLAVVTTSPGTRSQQNVMRRGFILLYTRIVLVKRWNQQVG
jgi:GNAT superfamily N-acetyltransferase